MSADPSRNHLPECLAMDIAEADAISATEQVALVMALLHGSGTRKHGTAKSRTSKRQAMQARSAKPRTIALEYLIGHLARFPWVGSLRFPDRFDAKSIAVAQPALDRAPGLLPPEQRLDVVPGPIDGVRDLLQGRDGGSVSVLAGGPRGSFADLESDHDEFLVLTLAEPPGRRPARFDFDAASLPEAAEKILREVVHRVGSTKPHASIATTIADNPKRDHSDALPFYIADHARVRAFHGSSVSAALHPFVRQSGIDAYLGVVRRTHAYLIAAAARTAVANRMLAFPVLNDATEHESADLKISGSPYRSHDFVPVPNVFLAMTAVTENTLLQGVRNHAHRTVSTHSLSMRSSTGSTRFVTQHHAIDAKRFHWNWGSQSREKSYGEVRAKLENWVAPQRRRSTKE